MRLSKGGFSLSEIEEMFFDDFQAWLKDAVDLQVDINKAASKG